MHLPALQEVAKTAASAPVRASPAQLLIQSSSREPLVIVPAGVYQLSATVLPGLRARADLGRRRARLSGAWLLRCV